MKLEYCLIRLEGATGIMYFSAVQIKPGLLWSIFFVWDFLFLFCFSVLVSLRSLYSLYNWLKLVISQCTVNKLREVLTRVYIHYITLTRVYIHYIADHSQGKCRSTLRQIFFQILSQIGQFYANVERYTNV